jgi:hypothetical protein
MSELNPKIDFEVLDNGNPNLIIVIDTSNWGAIEDKPSIIEITKPGYSDPIVLYYDKHKTTVLGSSILDASCSTCDDSEGMLPDGVYVITVKGSPDSYYNTKYFLKTSSIELEIAELYITKGVSDIALKNELSKIDYFLTIAKSFVKKGDFNSAGIYYDKAKNEINRISNC